MTPVFARVRWRLLGWTMLVLAVILALVGAVVYITLRYSLMAEVDRNLASRANEVAAEFYHFGGALISTSAYSGGVFYLEADPDGAIIANPQHVAIQALPLPLPATSTASTTITIQGEHDRLFLLPLDAGRAGHLYLVAGESLVPEERALQSLLLVLIASAGGGLLLSLAGASFLVSRSLIPIQRAYNRQREFSADAAHELRTPLTVLHAATDVLQQHRNEPLAANGQLFEDVQHEIIRMERLTADLLTLARSDLNELELAVAEVDLAALAGKVVRQVTPLAQERGLDLALVPPKAPVTVEADPNRLQQVVLILLDNALKYTPGGGTVRVQIARQGNEATLTVSDSGEGISAEHLARLFDRFYRVDPARSRAQGGAGLGLAIARSLVGAHGGQLSLTSQPGQGTTALVRLPLKARASAFARRFGGVTARLGHSQER
jgi:two-component system, OmpR family, sensor histidine kinase CiaH